MSLPDRLIALDLETTGTEPRTDRIVEFAFIELDHELEELGRWSQRVDPGVPIPPEATEVHGIGDDDVRGLPGFDTYAKRVQGLVSDAVLMAYNHRFDLDFLHYELVRAGERGLPLDVPAIDPLEIFRDQVPHSLEGAVRYYLERDHDGAHRAEGDVEATVEVFRAQRERDVDMVGSLEAALVKSDVQWLDRDRKVFADEDGVVCFGFGKHYGEPIEQHLEYVSWMLERDFGEDTKQVLQRTLKGEPPVA